MIGSGILDHLPRLPSDRLYQQLRGSLTPYPITPEYISWSRHWERFKRWSLVIILPTMLGLCIASFVLSSSSTQQSRPFFTALMFFGLAVGLFGLLLLLAALIGLPSAALAANISGQIGAERERGIYDLLCASDLGAFGFHWWIARSYFTVDPRRLRKKASALDGLLIVLLISLGAFFYVVFVTLILDLFYTGVSRSTPGAPGGSAIAAAILMISLLFTYNTYQFQSDVAATLLGMIVSARAGGRFEGQAWSVIACIGFQLGTLSPTLLALVVLLIRLVNDVAGEQSITNAVGAGLVLVIFLAVREILIARLRQHTQRILQGTDDEIRLVNRLALQRSARSLEANQREKTPDERMMREDS